MTKPLHKRSEVISCYQQGLSALEIAKQFHMHRRTINRIIARFKRSGGTNDCKSSGRPVRVATAEFVRLVEDLIRQNPEKSARALARELGVSRTTISRVIKEKLVRNEVIIPDDISSFDESMKQIGSDVMTTARMNEHFDPGCFEMILDEVPFPEVVKFKEEPDTFKDDADPSHDDCGATIKVERELDVSDEANTVPCGAYPQNTMIFEEGLPQSAAASWTTETLTEQTFARLLTAVKTEPVDNSQATSGQLPSVNPMTTLSPAASAVDQADFEQKNSPTCVEAARDIYDEKFAISRDEDHSTDESPNGSPRRTGDVVCPKCPFISTSYSELERHYLAEHCIYECAICKIRLAGRQTLMSHRVRHRLTTSCSLETVPLSTAGSSVKNKRRSKPASRKIQPNEQKYPCTICPMKASRYDVLEAHYESEHNKKLEASKSRRNRQTSSNV